MAEDNLPQDLAQSLSESLSSGDEEGAVEATIVALEAGSPPPRPDTGSHRPHVDRGRGEIRESRDIPP